VRFEALEDAAEVALVDLSKPFLSTLDVLGAGLPVLTVGDTFISSPHVTMYSAPYLSHSHSHREKE
jgi:hypothetical protein